MSKLLEEMRLQNKLIPAGKLGLRDCIGEGKRVLLLYLVDSCYVTT